MIRFLLWDGLGAQVTANLRAELNLVLIICLNAVFRLVLVAERPAPNTDIGCTNEGNSSALNVDGTSAGAASPGIWKYLVCIIAICNCHHQISIDDSSWRSNSPNIFLLGSL